MKALDEAVRFANKCAAHKFDPTDYADLIRLTRRVVAAGVRECNVPNASAESSRKRLTEHAKTMGVKVDYSGGLVPQFAHRGLGIQLPFLD